MDQTHSVLHSFQVSSFLVYLLCGLFSSNFIANFVAVVVLLMFDFWTVSSFHIRPCPITFKWNLPEGSAHNVTWSRFFAHHELISQTKNISGRLLVGLRYWNEVTDQGSNWRFETLEEVNPSWQSCLIFFQQKLLVGLFLH